MTSGVSAILAGLIAIIGATCVARADQSSGDWTVGTTTDGTGYYAATVNDSNLLLGKYCYLSSAKCIWLIASDTKCVEGNTYPALANSQNGAAPLQIVCLGQFTQGGEKLSGFYFSDWEQIEKLLSGSSRVGFAVPMQSDAFKVWRFSLSGMKGAVETMEGAFLNLLKKNGKSPQGTVTSTL